MQEPSVGIMLHEMLKNIQAGQVTPQSVEVLKGMMDLYERNETRNAEKEFNKAFAKLQSEIPSIEATKPVPNKDGTVRYRFAPFEEIMEKVQPILTSNGFSISFNSRFDNGRIVSICTIRHIGGHSQSNEFGARIGQGPPGSSEPQADASAKNYARRGALCDCLNISIDHDDDARMMGKPIGKALAEELRSRVKALGDKIDEQRFLAFSGVACSNPAKVEDYYEISDNRYDHLDQLLKRKEIGGASKW